MTNQQLDFARSRLKEMHDYVRHAVHQLVYWFSFFVTVNYGVMGWILVSSVAVKPVSSVVLITVSAVFFFQVILGIWTCVAMQTHLKQRGILIQTLEERISQCEPGDPFPPELKTVPYGMYSDMMLTMAIGLLPILVAWCVIMFSNLR